MPKLGLLQLPPLGKKLTESLAKLRSRSSSPASSPVLKNPFCKAESPDELALVRAAVAYSVRLVKHDPSAVVVEMPGIISCSTISTFCSIWQSVAAFRFLTGFFLGAYMTAVFVLVMEVIEPNQRTFLRSWLNWWGQSRIIYGLVAYWTRDWRNTFRIINLTALPVFALLPFVKEPPRWLIQRGRVKEAKTAMAWIAKVNGTKVDDKELEELQAEPNRPAKKYTYKDLFSTPKLRLVTLLAPLMVFSCATLSYGMDLKTGNLSGDLYVNQILMGICISFGKPLMFLFDRFCPGFSRRTLHQTSMGAVVICLIIVAILMQFDGAGWSLATTVACVIGLVFIEFQWDAVNLLNVELYPTVVRSSGVAFAGVIGGLGNTIAPQLLYLSKYWATAPFVVFIVIGICVIIISCAFLPDTKDIELLDTIEIETAVPLSPVDRKDLLMLTDFE